MKHHVTVGVDRSPESRAAARWGAREAALRQVPLRLAHGVGGPEAADGRLIGILSRSDLLQILLRRNHAIQEEILEDVVTHTLGLRPSALTVDVTEGLVPLSGTVGRRSRLSMLVRLCQSTDGVVDVIDRLTNEQDGTPVETPAAATRRS